MKDNEAGEMLEGLLARIEGLEKCIGVLGKVVIDNLPKVEGELIDGFEQFSEMTRQEKLHDVQVDLYERMAEWFRRNADSRAGKDPRTGPKPSIEQ